MTLTYYECKYCGKTYKQVERFRVHYCDERKKHEALFTIEGQLGFALYTKWISRRFGGSTDHEMFKRSRMFNAFIRFAKFYRKINGLNDLDQFLDLMIKRNIQPCNWVRDCVISFYLDTIDKKPPVERIESSVKSIRALSYAYDCSSDELFLTVQFCDIVDFVKLGELSPWILLNSKQFHRWLSRLTDEQQLIMESVIDSDKWLELFRSNQKYVTLARACCSELGI